MQILVLLPLFYLKGICQSMLCSPFLSLYGLSVGEAPLNFVGQLKCSFAARHLCVADVALLSDLYSFQLAIFLGFCAAPRVGVSLRQLCMRGHQVVKCLHLQPHASESKLENQIRDTNSISIVCKFHLTARSQGVE